MTIEAPIFVLPLGEPVPRGRGFVREYTGKPKVPDRLLPYMSFLGWRIAGVIFEDPPTDLFVRRICIGGSAHLLCQEDMPATSLLRGTEVAWRACPVLILPNQVHLDLYSPRRDAFPEQVEVTMREVGSVSFR